MLILEHPQLGPIKGRDGPDSTVEYRGIQYGSLKHKLASPVLYPDDNGIDSSAAKVLDATSYRPSNRVTGGREACLGEQKLIQHTLPIDTVESTAASSIDADTSCLTLNITCPKLTDGVARRLPVLVFIHGGGLKTGSTNWPQNNLARFVAYSASIDMPVVAVGVNYRVGPLGFMTSRELRDAGCGVNNGLKDQQTALQWIQKYIQGFHGDPETVCVLGQSAGAACTTFLLGSSEPLFKRAVLLAGTHIAKRPAPLAIHEVFYAQAVQCLGLDKVSPDERIEALLCMTGDQLAAKIPPFVPTLLAIDHDLCHVIPSFAALSGIGKVPTDLDRGWCKEIMVGDCAFDGSILSLALDHRKAGLAASLAASLDKSLGPAARDATFKLYHIAPSSLASDSKSTTTTDAPHQATHPDSDDTYVQILKFCGDVIFRAPTEAFASSHPCAYLFHFHQPNNWPGRWKGLTPHITDLAYLFQNYNDDLSAPEEVELARSFAKDVIAFAHGRQPWPPAIAQNENGKHLRKIYAVVEPSATGADPSLRETARVTDRPVWELMDRFGADRVLDAVETFLSGS